MLAIGGFSLASAITTAVAIYKFNGTSTVKKEVVSRNDPEERKVTQTLVAQSSKETQYLTGSSAEIQKASRIVEPAQPAPASKFSSTELDEARKYKERTDNPDLCRDVLASNKDKSKLRVCKLNKDGLDIEFMYYPDQIGEMPIKVRDMRQTYSALFFNLTKLDSLGLDNKQMDFSEDVFTGKLLMDLTNVEREKFTEKQCKLEITKKDGSQQEDWKIKCYKDSK
ncbi:hypothetical protein OVS_04305 [Mycoplasma ovis str. Michigan]|uniref:Uncharacterized protein n=2 Tax=Mycoplasma ovis TaxID=171632 RepID=A0ABM5P2B5_9MOLU|nr:hypothetical protein OVS_04305 [Mycoplasma ovis str. Michigan]